MINFDDGCKSHLIYAKPILVAVEAGVGYNSASGTIYVGNQGTNYVSILSGSTNKVIGNVTVGQGPVSPVFDPNNGYVYVTNSNSNNSPGNTVSVISTTLTPTQGIQQLIIFRKV